MWCFIVNFDDYMITRLSSGGDRKYTGRGGAKDRCTSPEGESVHPWS